MRHIILPFTLLMLSLSLGSATLLANPTVLTLTDIKQVIEAGPYIEYLKDESNALTIQDVLKSKNFQASTQRVPNFGLTTATYWVKLPIHTAIANTYLQIKNPLLGNMVLFIKNGDSLQQRPPTGLNHTFSSREVQSNNFLYKLPVGSYTCYLKIGGHLTLSLPIQVGNILSFYATQTTESSFVALAFGLMVAMVLYNLLVFFSIKDKLYLTYVIYLLSLMLIYAVLKGFAFQYIWPNLPLLNSYVSTIASVSVIAALFFSQQFLQIKKLMPKGHLIINGIIVLLGVAIILNLLNRNISSTIISQALTVLVTPVLIIIGVKLYNNGLKEARYYLVGWSILLVSVSIYILLFNNVMPYNLFTNNMILIGSSVEVIMFSLALSDRINQLKKEKTEALTQAQVTRIEAQQAKLQFAQEREELIQQQHKELEDQIHQRTEELQKLNLKLKNRLVTVYDSRVSLSALGENAATISNNMRDPLSSMHQLTDALQLNVHDLLKLLQAYETIVEKGGMDDSLLKPIHELKAKLDINMAQQEIPKLFDLLDDSMHQAVTLVDEIHELANIRKDSYESASLNTIISNTINLFSQAQLQGIEVKQELGDSPSIDCLPGKLSHLLINILENAIDSIHARTTAGEKGCITIRTTHKQPSRQIELTIQDNGVGSTGTYWKKTIEPFKTKKAHGQGIGLTSISRIASLHKAGLALNLQKWGATLTILFPIEQPSAYPHEKLYETPSFENLEIDIDE